MRFDLCGKAHSLRAKVGDAVDQRLNYIGLTFRGAAINNEEAVECPAEFAAMDDRSKRCKGDHRVTQDDARRPVRLS